jgi:hypothetical protein
MTDIQIFDYSVYTGVMDNGQEILVQIFTNPDSGKFLMGQIAFKIGNLKLGSCPYLWRNDDLFCRKIDRASTLYGLRVYGRLRRS